MRAVLVAVVCSDQPVADVAQFTAIDNGDCVRGPGVVVGRAA